MPIASKLLYFQRRPSPAPPDPDPDPPDPRRRPCRDSHRRRRSSLSSSSHHKPGLEILQGNHANKSGGSAGNITEHVAAISSSARLNRSVSDHGRLPDAVQQARERLLQRLNSVDLSGRRQKTWSSETFWAGLTRPADVVSISTSADNILASLTSCFQPGESVVAGSKVEESAAEAASAGNADDHQLMPAVTLLSEPIPEPQQQQEEEDEESAAFRKEDGGAGEGEATRREPPSPPSAAAESPECSICLERCAADDGGLVRLRCGHVFHSACLERWLRSRPDCPYCRASVLL